VVQHKTRKYKLKSSLRAPHENVSLIGRCRFVDALKDAVAAQQEQIQALSAHLTEGQGCDIRGRASGMLGARGTRPDSGSALHSAGLTL
jgi:hypothetical protein